MLGADLNGAHALIAAIKFMDKACKQVSIYDPNHSLDRNLGQMHQLEDNEELIGVYGKKVSYFHAFGFIVRVREND